MLTIEDFERDGLRAPTDIMERAVAAPDAETALRLLREANKITPDALTIGWVDPREFRTADRYQRHAMLTGYMIAEWSRSFERGDRRVATPIDLRQWLSSPATNKD